MSAQGFIPGDALPGAPELAGRGPRAVGVATLTLTNPNQIDVLRSLAVGALKRRTRTLRAEVWYPTLEGGSSRYRDHLLRRSESGEAEPFAYRFEGRARRNAAPDRSQGPAPLVVVSHGYPGSRLQFSWLGENLASKGYAVMALDHTDSTVRDRRDVLSSLRNRPLDIALALRVATDIEHRHPLLHGLWDSARAALVGFSMGGMGTLLALGAGYDPALLQMPQFEAQFQTPLWRELLSDLTLGEPFFEDLSQAVRDKVQAAVLLAPWGGQAVWTERALARVHTPLFIVSGSDDDIAAYAATRRIFEATTGSERYLLTLQHARHNIAMNPPPSTLLHGSAEDWWRRADPVWDTRRILSLLQHHLTAYLGVAMRGLPLEGFHRDAAAGSDWPGYPPRSTQGLTMERADPTG